MMLDLLRHGETERGGGLRGSLDDALTATGWQQLRAAVRPQEPWQRIVSSPLQRCARFAEELAVARNLPLHFEAALRELHFGDWEGCSTAQLMQNNAEALGRFWDNPYDFTPPGAEPLAAFEARVLAALRELRDNCAGEHLLLVTHGGVMRLLLARARGLAAHRLLQVEVAYAQRARLRAESSGVFREMP
jgi:alpha-ribazole phosphatase